MGAYAAGRLVASVPVLAVVAVLAFALLRLTPGDPAASISGDQATDERIQEVRRSLGLDESVPRQFANWVSDVAHGDLGTSLFTGEPLTTSLGQRLPATLSLAILGELVGVLIGVPLGVLAARLYNSSVDRAVMLFAVLGFSVPAFWLGYNLIFLFTLRLGWLPPNGYEPISSGPWPWLKYLILPALTLGLGVAALIARMTRASMLEVLRQDYVRTARAKGLPESAVVWRHALRSAALPVITVIGLSTANAMAGTAVIETVFSIPGMGRLFVQAASNRDYPVLQGAILLTGVLFVLINLLVDLSYVLVDPRVRY